MNTGILNQMDSVAANKWPSVDSREALLREIMEYDFIALDLNLYLDTHPNDADALRRHMEAVEKSGNLKEQYQQMYGPLTASAVKNASRWTWNENPWPWMTIR